MWEVILLDDVDDWFMDLAKRDPASAALVAGAIDLLEREEPTLGRPVVDRIKGSRHHNMKELRPGSSRRHRGTDPVHLRPSTTGDPLVAGDKSRAWKQWYHQNIPLAERRYDDWLDAQDKEL